MPFIDIDGTPFWFPRMIPKGYEIAQNSRRYKLLHGPRYSGKSNTAQNLLLLHIFHHDACAGIFVKGMKGAEGTGVWPQICGPTEFSRINEWNAECPPNYRIEFTIPPTMKSDTKLRYFRIRNTLGTESEVQLHTITHDRDVENVVKDQAFSFIYIVEADRFGDVKVFRRLVEQLRHPGCRAADERIILDCNPPKEGEDHWLHRLFIRDAAGNYIPDIELDYQEVSIGIDDNPFLEPQKKKALFDNNKHDSVDLDRLYFGKWRKDRKGTIFEEQFRQSFHIIGDTSKEDPEILVPHPQSFELPHGLDIGDATNHAVIVAAKRQNAANAAVYDIIDEIVTVGRNYSLDDIGRRILEKMDRWGAYVTKSGKKPQFRFHSDSSSLRYLSIADGSQASTLYQMSNGRIRLQGVKKGAGSVGSRVNLLKRLLFEERIFISAGCKATFAMLAEARKGNGLDPFPEDSPHKHVFDALTYMLGYEEPRILGDFGGDRPQTDSLIILPT